MKLRAVPAARALRVPPERKTTYPVFLTNLIDQVLRAMAQQPLPRAQPCTVQLQTIVGLFFTVFNKYNLGYHDTLWSELSWKTTV